MENERKRDSARRAVVEAKHSPTPKVTMLHKTTFGKREGEKLQINLGHSCVKFLKKKKEPISRELSPLEVKYIC
jgi:hypothetical protein